MKGDFSRLMFDEVDQYSRVLMQQGRVLLDADWNQSAEIQIRDLRALARDVMGPHAAPAGVDGDDGTGFLIKEMLDANKASVKNDFSIGEGRYYVQGILCRNPPGTAYRGHADWPNQADFVDGKPYLVYLDVWERHITGAEADGLGEPALNGADTCTRSEIVWQVRSQIISAAVKPDSLKQNYQAFLDVLELPVPGRLAARVDKPADSDSPCMSAPESKYQGAGNQLYRVEIHTGGQAPTFKWSRDNGSQIYPVVDLSGAIVTLQNTGRDDRSSLQPDDMVELIDDQYTLLNRAAPLLRVSVVNREANQVTLDPPPPPSGPTPGTHRYLRRWDSGEIDISKASADAVDKWISLEDGVQVKFDFDVKKQQFVTGQYWTIPARTATGDVIWPQEGGKPAFRTPQGIEHAYAPLALVSFKPGQAFDKAVDLRRTLTKAWK